LRIELVRAERPPASLAVAAAHDLYPRVATLDVRDERGEPPRSPGLAVIEHVDGIVLA
jgi:hypothetical protein